MKCADCKTSTHGRRKRCPNCTQRAYRKKYPYKYAYQTLKDNAKRRGKEFKLTFEQFKEFAIKVDYLKKKGVKATMYHIDRKREQEGYTLDNLQLLTNRDNVKKYAVFRAEWNEEEREMDFYKTVDTVNVSYDPDIPF